MNDTQRTGARVRASAAKIVDAVVSAGRSLDVALAEFDSEVAARDRPLLRVLSFGAIRSHWQLEAWLDRLLDRPLKPRDRVIHALLAIGLVQLTDTRIPDHAAVSQTVEATKLLKRPKLAGLVNAILRRFQRDNLAAEAPNEDVVRFNHPRWLIDAIKSDWPDDWRAILEANDARGPMWLRVYSRRIAVADYVAMLKSDGIEVVAGPGTAIRLREPRPVAELPGFAEGLVSVQDAAAQIAAPWLADGLDGRILDACAAPGGKSAHLKELGGDSIELTALDIDAARLETTRANLARLSLDATVTLGDASTPGTWWDGTPYDGILLDAPCSASGVIRRHPDIKLLRREADIAALSASQAALLQALWPLLEPGGKLLYVTCSVLAAENDDVVSAFLDATSDARENDMLQNNNIRDVMRRKACGYQVLPGTAGLDGFYFACLEKVAR